MSRPIARSRARRRPAFTALSAAAAVLGFAGTAAAVDKFEIQVYGPDVNAPGHAGLEVHTNYTLRGARSPAYEGEIPANHAARLTLEPALGLTEWAELGAYFQTMAAPDEGARFAGVKLRLKTVVPRRFTGKFFVGLNVEVGRVPRAVEDAGWANEFRPIVGYDDGWVLIDVNPIIGYALSGDDRLAPELEPAGKLALNTQLGFMVGIEYYAGIGRLSAVPAVREQEHLGFVTLDLAPPKGSADDAGAWELNVGVGHGFTDGTPQDWIAKSIVGRAF